MSAATVLSIVSLYFLVLGLNKSYKIFRSRINVVRTDPGMAFSLIEKRGKMADGEKVYDGNNEHFKWLNEAKKFLKYYQP